MADDRPRRGARRRPETAADTESSTAETVTVTSPDVTDSGSVLGASSVTVLGQVSGSVTVTDVAVTDSSVTVSATAAPVPVPAADPPVVAWVEETAQGTWAALYRAPRGRQRTIRVAADEATARQLVESWAAAYTAGPVTVLDGRPADA